MEQENIIVRVEKPGQEEWMTIGGGIGAYNKEQAGDDGSQSLCYVLKGPDETILGGVIGATHYDWLYVDLMWIRSEYRKMGYGSQLLELAEEEAYTRGAKYAYLDTFSFQAPVFYEKHGYQIFGTLDDFPAGHQRFYLRKEL